MLDLIEFFKGDRFAMNAGIELMEVKEGYGRARMLITPEHLNGGGFCQGGAIFTLADLVFAALVNQGESLTFAVNSTIYYHVSAHEGDVLRAEGRIMSDHRRMPAAEVVVTNQEGVHIATFTGQAYVGRTANTFSTLE